MDSASTQQHQVIGGLPPPPGVIPDFNNPTLDYVIASVVVCLAITTLTVGIRMYTVFCIIKSHGWADYTSFLAWIGFLGFCGVDIVGMRWGGGRHQWNVTVENLIKLLQIINYVEISYGPIMFITKLSILLQIRRLFKASVKDRFRIALDIIIWLNALFYFADTVVEIFQCVPRSKIFDPQIPGRCVNISDAIIVTACINIASDISIFVLPLVRIWRLQMPLSKKVGVSAIFAFGLFACLAAVARLVASVQTANSDDSSYEIMHLALWSDAEVGSGIVCGCLPVIPAFFRHFGGRGANEQSPLNTHLRKKAQGSSSFLTAKRIIARGNPLIAHTVSSSDVEMNELGADQWASNAEEGELAEV